MMKHSHTHTNMHALTHTRRRPVHVDMAHTHSGCYAGPGELTAKKKPRENNIMSTHWNEHDVIFFSVKFHLLFLQNESGLPSLTALVAACLALPCLGCLPACGACTCTYCSQYEIALKRNRKRSGVAVPLIAVVTVSLLNASQTNKRKNIVFFCAPHSS